MNNVTLKLTINAALQLLVNSTISPEIRNDIHNSIVMAFGVTTKATRYLNLTLKSVPSDHKIRCMAAVRNHLGWEIGEAKDFVQTVLNGTPNSLSGLTDDIRKLRDSLELMGCEVVVDTWGCEDPE